MLKKQYLKTKPICKVTFTLPAEAIGNGQEVRIVGDFNNWSWEDGVAMKKSGKQFKAEISLPIGRNYEFRYLIDNNSWTNDWEADAYVPSPYFGIDNSVVFVENSSNGTTGKQASAQKDNLKKIEGIGPKIEGLLKGHGIMTFADLADAKLDLLKDILSEAGSRYRMHDPNTWVEQAKMARDGRWEDLDKWQKELKGGRR